VVAIDFGEGVGLCGGLLGVRRVESDQGRGEGDRSGRPTGTHQK
jgi:hypothetical protein